MNTIHVKYLLVGAGLASSSAAQAIREIDRESPLMLVGQEVNRPYHRPPLSKEYLQLKGERKPSFTTSPEWFTENNVVLRTGRRAAHLDPARHLVTLDDGESVVYDRLLLATGATPRRLAIPGADLPSIHYLRSIGDADRILLAIEKAKAEGRPHAKGRGRATVIGAGVLGVELAATLTQRGIGVDLVCKSAHPWSKFAGETAGRVALAYLQSKGVRVHVNTAAQQLLGDGRVQRIALSSGETIDADFAVGAVGISPNKELLRSTSIAAENAILVDAHARTSDEHIYAAGDCAAMFDPLFGKYRHLDHWDNAQVSGRLAGRNMAGADEAYSAINMFFSDVFDLSLNVWGAARHVKRRLARGSTSLPAPDFVEIGLDADGRVAEALAVNHKGEDEELKALVGRRVQLAGREEAVKDPGVPLSTLLG